ncbi:hypothetical protein LY90DRAFT_630957 [Neocallimastix californiae]|uniref:Uncharacterized protein n=1 Tax=Neocallimastix californiae TaxID=1754190 RepID=A0A1Y2AMH3_9FUNG|nr:hypothetical protein LY90DRAFT_630957 [Neocallimastix californiae]|eukprot:ORY23751.1 hypothetical protein LY90DRAFT_630957 [Neocallimastix californiae]
MVSNNSESSLTIYLRKQKKFVTLVNSIQKAISSKDYRKQGYTFNSYVKKNWNISKAQAYRYLISAKVLDQLKEFKILPNYERLCKIISSLTKTHEQVTLLWKTVLRKVENRLDEIDTSFITKVWKELCENEKYNYICHIKNNIGNNNEDSKNRDSEISENKIFTENESNSNIISNNLSYSIISSPENSENCILINNNSSQNSYYPSPSFSEIELQSVNNYSSQISFIPSPSYSEADLQNINEITTQQKLFTHLPVINKETLNSNMDNSQQLDLNNQLLFNSVNDYNNNSQIDSIPQDYSYDSFEDIFASSITELNNNSKLLYYSMPVTVVSSSNNLYYPIDNNQSTIQAVPLNTPNTIYYMINTPNQQPIIISS